MPLPTTSPKLNTGITIDGKIKALADLVATHERRTFASLVEHAIWLYVQKRLPSVEIERVLKLLVNNPKAAVATSLAAQVRKGGTLPEAPALVKRREKPAPVAKAPTKAKPASTKSSAKGKTKTKTKR